jgi:hypothetical protein
MLSFSLASSGQEVLQLEQLLEQLLVQRLLGSLQQVKAP